MEKKMEELGEVQLYYIDNNTIETVENLFPVSVADKIKTGEAFGLAIEEEGEIRGAISAVFYTETDHIEVLSIYVDKESRRRYLGSTLLLQMIDAVMEETEGELRAVSMSFLENIEGIRPFLDRMGFMMESSEEEGSFFINRESLENSVLNNRRVSYGSHIRSKDYGNDLGSDNYEEGISPVSWATVSEYEKKKLYRELEKAEIAYMTLTEFIAVNNEISFVKKDVAGKIKACCIITGEEKLVLSQYYSENGNVRNGIEVLFAALSALLQVKGEWTLEIPCMTKSSIRLLENLIPGAERVGYIRAVLWM